jgi:hypothetical protein
VQIVPSNTTTRAFVNDASLAHIKWQQRTAIAHGCGWRTTISCGCFKRCPRGCCACRPLSSLVRWCACPLARLQTCLSPVGLAFLRVRRSLCVNWRDGRPGVPVPIYFYDDSVNRAENVVAVIAITTWLLRVRACLLLLCMRSGLPIQQRRGRVH